MGEYSDSKYGVFIIESMDLENENKGKLDGYSLKTILDLCDIPNQYYYIRTGTELGHLMEEFEQSSFRFLHLSCHANKTGIVLTYDYLDFDQLELTLGPSLRHRRLFLSACEVAVFELAEHFIPKYHCFSMVGTPDTIDYDKAAVFWSSFYFLMYSNDTTQMIQAELQPTLESVSKTFNVKINYFSIIKDQHPKSFDHLKAFYINPKGTSTKLLKTKFKNQDRIEGDTLFDLDADDSSS